MTGENHSDADADLLALQAFARELLMDWPDDAGVDGFALQDLAVKHGLLRLKDPAPTKPCSEMNCACAEYYDDADFAGGAVQCYERTARLTGHNVGVQPPVRRSAGTTG